MLYAILCYNDETVVESWSKEKDAAVIAARGKVDTSGNWRGCQIYDSLVLADGGGLT